MASKRGKEKAKHDYDGDASWNKAGNGGKKNEDAAWKKGDSRYAWPGVSPAPDSHIAWAKDKVEAAKEEESWEGRDHSDWQYDMPRPSNTHDKFGHGSGEEEEVVYEADVFGVQHYKSVPVSRKPQHKKK